MDFILQTKTLVKLLKILPAAARQPRKSGQPYSFPVRPKHSLLPRLLHCSSAALLGIWILSREDSSALSGQESSRCKGFNASTAGESQHCSKQHGSLQLFCLKRENERKEKPQKTSTHMKEEGAWKTGRQVYTLDPVKSNRRRQTIGGCAHVRWHLFAEGMEPKVCSVGTILATQMA